LRELKKHVHLLVRQSDAHKVEVATMGNQQQAKHIEIVRAEIKKLNPDILLLQEVGSEAAIQETLKPLGEEWEVAMVSRFQQGGFLSGQQLAIAARFPAESAWAEAWQSGWAGAPRGFAYATFMIQGKRLAVYCIHLKSNLGEPILNTAKREDSIEQLVSHIQSKEGRTLPADMIVIGGDFNTDHPDSPTTQSPSERSFSLLYQEGSNGDLKG
jgi:endonuclease/exonuclease/phosphatase family metal-dependent hydrolase